MGGKTERNRGLIRQWRLLRALQASRMGLTFPQLIDAADDAVSERTIRRDVDTLTFAGFPIDVVTGDYYGTKPTRVFWRKESIN